MNLLRDRSPQYAVCLLLLLALATCAVLPGTARAAEVSPQASDWGEITFSPASSYPGGSVYFNALTKWFSPVISPAGMYTRMSLFGNKPAKMSGNAPNSDWVSGYDSDYGGNCWKYSSGWMWYTGRYDLNYYGRYQLKSTTPHNLWTFHLVGANEMWEPDDWYSGYLYVR